MSHVYCSSLNTADLLHTFCYQENRQDVKLLSIKRQKRNKPVSHVVLKGLQYEYEFSPKKKANPWFWSHSST